MATDSLRAHLIDELRDLRDAEEQLTKALPKLAQAATAKRLRSAFQKHLKETRGHASRLDRALQELGERATSKTCEAMKGLLKEGQSMVDKTPAGALRDAVMITGAQKVEHYEMASYGTARTYAQVLGEPAVARLLAQTLREEKHADRTLTQIAERSVNVNAAEEWQSLAEESALSRTAEWVGTTAGHASRRLSQGVRRAATAVGLAQDSTAGGTPKRRSRRGRRRPGAGRRSKKR
jgi:ferritin-like metal-binding protein YciE